MIIDSNPDFDEPFSDSTPDAAGWDGQLGFDPYLLVMAGVAIVAVIAICWLADYLGREYRLAKLRQHRTSSARYIYKSVRWYLDRALKSSGAVVLERAREVAEVMNARLGYVIDLSSRQNKLLGDLKTALDGQKDSTPADPTPKVSVPLATDQHYFRVWKALQSLDAVWKEDTVIPMIEAAQRELATGPRIEVKPVDWSFGLSQKPAMTKPAGAKPAAAAKLGAPAPLAAANPIIVESAPPPEPPSPPTTPPPPKKAKNLPVHKRNMLA
jgi:hypothetical protein